MQLLRTMRKKRRLISKEKRIRYRFILVSLLMVNLLFIGVWYWNAIDRRIPDRIFLFQNQKAQIDFDVPMEGSCREAKEVIAITNGGRARDKKQSFEMDQTVQIKASTLGSYTAEIKLFGIFHYKYIHFDVIEQARVMPSGRAVGLYIRSDGIMVLGTSAVDGKDGFSYEPAKDILQPGDRIQKIDGETVANIDAVIAQLQEGSSKRATLEVMRNGNTIHVKLEKVKTKDGEYKIGTWLREDTEGIGTLTFVTEQNQFAALGHGITDIDTGKLISLEEGSVYPAIIEDIQRGKKGSPGELIGSVALGQENYIGKIKSNTALGITGTISRKTYQYQKEKALPVGLKQEVKKGAAWILCQMGKKVEKYRVDIEEIHINSRDNKGLVLHVTDQKLLKKSGGIVQGMSGAPIIQNGKVIGAVTHVFVNDPTGGYGTFMENML